MADNNHASGRTDRAKVWTLWAALLVFSGPPMFGATLTVTVTSPADAGGTCPGADCTLRQAIATAAAGETINFSLPPRTAITLTSAQLTVNKNLTIAGPGANLLSVQRSSAVDTPGFRIFEIFSGAVVNISGLTISNGANPPSEDGGNGILNRGTLTVSNCNVTGNKAFIGGGIASLGNTSSTTINNCNISGNSAVRFGGGVTHNGLMMKLTNCTISGNSGCPEGGAGIHNNSGNNGVLTILNSTIAGNSGGSNGGGVQNLSGLVKISGTIIALNTAPTGPDVRTDVFASTTSQGHNLIGDGSGGNITAAIGDQIGTAAAPINPILGPLQDNGGPTKTRAPLSGSPAIDKGHSGGVAVDQRGFPRPVDRVITNAAGGDGSDIGAVELSQAVEQTGPTFTVTTTLERNLGQCATDDCSLIEALNVTNAVADANTINFKPGLAGAIGTAIITPSGLAITRPVTINGPGARLLTITGRTSARVFNVSSQSVHISGLNLVNGRVTNEDGGIIRNTGGLTLTECNLTNGYAAAGGVGDGGAIHNALGASVDLVRCTLSGSKADHFGGGIFNEGMLTVTNCTFSGNTAIQGGGIYSAFSNNASKVSLRNCTITKCSASDAGTGTGDGGGGLHVVGNSGQYNLRNSIIAGNTATRNPELRGNFFSDGHNLIRDVGFSTGLSENVKGDQVGTSGAPREALLASTLANNGGPTDTYSLQSASTAINNGDDALAPGTDQRGYTRNGISDIGAFEFQGLQPATLANISTRLRVETGDNILIGGFIITGSQPKNVMVRAIGPSLSQFFSDTLADPTLELRDGAGALIESNDNWVGSPNKQAIMDTTIPPSNDLEAAIVATLPANNAGYTAIVRGAGGVTGIGVVEAFDLDRSVNSKLANISTRGLVQTGNNVLIAGTIALGNSQQKVIIRAIGPSLPFGGRLENPALELRDGNGGLLEANDDWVDSTNKQAIIDSSIPPSNDLESAIVRTLDPAAYTAIVRGVNDTTGIAVVEVYALQ